jgi:hypothetical protein
MTRVGTINRLVYWCGAGYYMPVIADGVTRWHKVAAGYPESIYADDPFELL